MLNAAHIRDRYVLRFRTLWPILLGLFVLAGTACEALAIEGVRSSVEAGREVRQLEEWEVRPLEEQLLALYEDEIEPRQAEIEDLYFQGQEIEDTVIRPLWESQKDPWGPGGEAFEAQQEFDARYQEIEQLYRALDLEDRELQLKYQHGSFDPWQSPEAQAKEDERYELQRELDQLYQRGWEPIEEIYDEINRLQNGAGWNDSDTQDKIDEINRQIEELYDQANQLLFGEMDDINNELNALYESGRAGIDELWRQIENERNSLANSNSEFFVDAGYLEELESRIRFLEEERDRIITGLYARQDAIYSEEAEVLSEIDVQIAVVEAELETLFDSPPTTIEVAPKVFAVLDSLYVELVATWDEVEAVKVAADQKYWALFAAKDEAVSHMKVQIAELRVKIEDVDDATAHSTHGHGDHTGAVVAFAAQAEDLKDAIIAVQTETENAVAVVVAQAPIDLDGLFVHISDLEAEIADLEAIVDDASVVDFVIDKEAVAALEVELDELYAARAAGAAHFARWPDYIDRSIDEESKFWQVQIEMVQSELNVAYDKAGSSTVVDDSHLQSLYAQMDVMEDGYQSRINHLEDRRWELENSVDALYSDDPAQQIYEEIDRLYGVINQLADGSQHQAHGHPPHSNDVNWDLIDQMQQTAWEMEQNLQDRTRELEDQLWALDDALQLFYRNSELENREVQTEMDDAFQAIQQRRYELDDMRFAIDAEMNDFFHSFDDGRNDVEEEIRKMETELFTPIRARIRVLENELSDLRDEARALKSQVRHVRRDIEERRRNVEDQVFDLIENAVDAASAVVVEEPVTVGAGE